MKILAVGHSLVIDSNRKFWGHFARQTESEVDLICPKVWSSNLKPEIPFVGSESDSKLRRIFAISVFFRGNGSFFFFSPRSLWRIFQAETYDAIYLNQETWAMATLVFILCKFFSKNKDTPLYLCVAQNIRKEKLRFLHPYERLISRFVFSFLHCSQGVEDVLRWKGIRTPSYYFPLPFDEEVYRVKPSKSAPFTLGYLGRLSEDKGLGILLEALDQLNGREIQFPLIIGGKGPLETLLTSKPYVQFLGLIPHSEAHTFYDHIHLFVLPSQTRPHWKEQFGRVMTESFGAGKPVLGSSSGSIPEVLTKLDWPWIFKEDSVSDLKDKIIQLHHWLQQREGQDQLAHSIQLNRELFSQASVAASLYQIFSRDR